MKHREHIYKTICKRTKPFQLDMYSMLQLVVQFKEVERFAKRPNSKYFADIRLKGYDGEPILLLHTGLCVPLRLAKWAVDNEEEMKKVVYKAYPPEFCHLQKAARPVLGQLDNSDYERHRVDRRKLCGEARKQDRLNAKRKRKDKVSR